MLRYVFRIYRAKIDGEDEDWIEYLRRAKNSIVRLTQDFGMQDWVETQRRRKWQFAGRLARTNDGRWSRLILDWSPYNGFGRDRGHPATRWSDQLEKFAGGSWLDVATDEHRWDFLEEGFVTHDAV